MDPDPIVFLNPYLATGLIIVLLICSAIVSGSEVAFFSLKPTDLEDLEGDERKSSANALALLRNPNPTDAPRHLLATILVLNNLINVAIILIATVTAQQLFPVESLPIWLAICIHIAGVTFLIVLFGEVIPKLFATTHNVKVARFTGGLLLLFQKLLIPFWKPLVALGRTLDRNLKRPVQDLSAKDLENALILTDNENRSTDEKEIYNALLYSETRTQNK